MQIKTTLFWWIRLFVKDDNVRGKYKEHLASEQLFFTIIFDFTISCFVWISLHFAIVISLQLFLFENILSYIHKKHSYIYPVLFPSNIQCKHYIDIILCFFLIIRAGIVCNVQWLEKCNFEIAFVAILVVTWYLPTKSIVNMINLTIKFIW